MVLDRVPENFFTENEQIAFGTGVLVDGLDFSDDKMLVGRTFSYSDTQRYRVGPNYLQLPVNPAKNAKVATNQRDGQMAYGVDLGEGQNPHVNYEPSILGGLREARVPDPRRAGPGDHRPAHPQADPADQRLPAGRRALPAVAAVGEGRPGRQPGRRAEPVRPPDPGADGLAPLPVSRTSWASGSATASASAPTTSVTCQPLQSQTLTEDEERAAGQPRQERPAGRQRQDHDALRPERARGHLALIVLRAQPRSVRRVPAAPAPVGRGGCRLHTGAGGVDPRKTG